jgi:transposase
MSVIQLRDDYDASTLRRLAKRCRDARQIRRLLALAAVYDGMSRTEAAKVGGMDRQTLRDWAHRFNEAGPEGLTNRKGAGRLRWLSDDQMRELAEIVETGPDPAVDGVVRWRRIDLKRVIEERFGVVYSERAIFSLLDKLGFSHITGRPQHPKQEPHVLETFKKTWRCLSCVLIMRRASAAKHRFGLFAGLRALR